MHVLEMFPIVGQEKCTCAGRRGLYLPCNLREDYGQDKKKESALT
jgi:hypothetical protein